MVYTNLVYTNLSFYIQEYGNLVSHPCISIWL